MLAVRTDRDQRIGGRCAVGSVEGEVQILTGIADLSVVQRLAANAGLRDEPPPSRRGRPTTVADVSPRSASSSASTRRTMARPSSGSMMAGDCRNAECPQPPDNSSSTQDDPADAVPYIGSLRASDWSLHGCRLAAVIRRLARRRPPGAVCGSAPSRQRGRDPASHRRRRVARGAVPAIASAHDIGNVIVLVGQPEHDTSVRSNRWWRRARGATEPAWCRRIVRQPRARPADGPATGRVRSA